MRDFGLKIGIAFQIKDDLFDYGSGEIGKPLAIDIKEKKMTLPLIHALQNASYVERQRIIQIVKNQNSKPHKVARVIDFVNEMGGIAYATQKMEQYDQEAMQILNGFEDSVYKRSLSDLVRFTIERTR